MVLIKPDHILILRFNRFLAYSLNTETYSSSVYPIEITPLIEDYLNNSFTIYQWFLI